jgi:hypothetical protein
LGAAPTKWVPGEAAKWNGKSAANTLLENVNRTAGREKSAPAVCLLLMTS